METPAILPRSVKLCAVLSGKALWESCGGQEVGTGQKGLKIEDGREQAWPLGATASSFMSGREYSFQSNMLIKSLAQRSQGMGNGGGGGGAPQLRPPQPGGAGRTGVSAQFPAFKIYWGQ